MRIPSSKKKIPVDSITEIIRYLGFQEEEDNYAEECVDEEGLDPSNIPTRHLDKRHIYYRLRVVLDWLDTVNRKGENGGRSR